jgi:polyketide biosynthesis enoyl-CoA hydratase PksI
MSGKLLQERLDADGILHLQMADAPGRNALSASLVEELRAALARASQNPSARVCILGGLPDVFCAGGSKEMLLDLAQGQVAATDILLTRSILEVSIPTIAAMQGAAVGGGLILGLCCDLVVLSQESRYGCSFMNLGFTPGMGTTRLLQRSFGEHIAAEMMFSGQYFRGSHFQGQTGVNYIVGRDQVMTQASDLALRIADKPRAALELLKRSLSLGKRTAFEEARTMESMMHELSFRWPETKARIEQDYLSTAQGGV